MEQPASIRQTNGAASLFVLGSFVVSCSAKVARLPQPGESLTAEAFTLEAGGKGLNLALGALRLGASVDGLLAVGDDVFAEFAAGAVQRAGLPPTMLRRYRGQTGSGIGFTDARGENCLAVYPGANSLLSAVDIRAAGAAVAAATLVLAQFEIGDEPIAEAFTLAHAAGRRTLLNPSPFRMPDEAILRRTSILVLNRVEAAALAVGLGATPAMESDLHTRLCALAARIMERGPDTVIVTLGADGALACRRDAPPLHQPAFAVRTVDTLGAGDAFTAGLAASLVKGRSLSESMRRAAACGALASHKLGVFDALPTGPELEAFLAAE